MKFIDLALLFLLPGSILGDRKRYLASTQSSS